MKRVVLLIFFIAGSLCLSAQQAAIPPKGLDYDSIVRTREELAVGKILAPFAAAYQSQVFTNKNLSGKIVFVNLWFAACPPCMAEMNALNELYDSLKTRPNFEFISFTYDSQNTIDSVIKRYHIQYKVLQVTQQDCYRLNLNNGFPASLIVDAGGKIKYLNVGGYNDGGKVRESVFELYYPRLLKEL